MMIPINTILRSIFGSISPVFQSRTAAVILMALGIVFLAVGVYLLFSKPKGKTVKKQGDIEVYSKSIIGDRSYQQDFCLLPKDINSDRIKDVGMLAIVCDGMGGMEGGERASRCCAETVYSGYYQIGSADNVCDLLRSLIHEADKEVHNLAAENGRRLNSGTTVAAAVYLNSKIYWASAGDSRIYLYQEDRLTQITRDHNLRLKLLQDMDNGLISKEQFDSAGNKEALISYVGMGRNILIDTGELSFPEDMESTLILCSDGIYKTLTEKAICRILREENSAEEIPEVLVNAAMTAGRAGKHDNISAIVIRRNKQKGKQKNKRRK